LPCICKAIDAKTSFFTDNDFENLKRNDKNIFLLNAQSHQDENIIKYLKIGEEEGVNKKFLTSRRNPWYSLENRPPAPIWVSVFNRNGLRFIRNEANISDLTSFHCIYPKQNNLFSKTDIDLLFAYLLTDTAKEIFEDNCREYGNGLQKFEPNDLNKGNIVDLWILNEQTKNQILTLYKQYREETLKNNNALDIIKEIDQIIIKNYAI
ncbi:MAG: SAM-dependent DNA methyltransferase, partial [Sulfurimonas sp.]|nr:SAM-dependent DNA methyltransferase [Sulfurimonas sp.]